MSDRPSHKVKAAIEKAHAQAVVDLPICRVAAAGVPAQISEADVAEHRKESGFADMVDQGHKGHVIAHTLS